MRLVLTGPVVRRRLAVCLAAFFVLFLVLTARLFYLQAIAAEGQRLYFVACPFAGFNIILSMYFTSSERPRPAHIISLLRGFLVILPMALVLARLVGIRGVWCSFPATELAVAVLGLLLFPRTRRQAA